MNRLTVPEDIIIDSIESVFKVIRQDYNNQSDKKNSLLYKIVQDNQLDRYNFFDQAKKVFITTPEDPRHLKIYRYFNWEHIKPPSVHLTLPQETPSGNAIDMQSFGGDGDLNFDEDNGAYNEYVSRGFETTFQFVIIEDNTAELTLLYHTLKMLIASLQVHFENSGLRNIRISGNDIQPKPTGGQQIYMRAINMQFVYSQDSPNLLQNSYITQLFFNHEIYIDNTTQQITLGMGIDGTDIISNSIKRNISVIQEDTLSFIVQEDSIGFDFANYTGKLQAKDSSGNVVLELTQSEGDIKPDGREAEITFPSNKTNITPETYSYDLQFTENSSGKLFTPLYGDLIIKEQVTT